MASINDFIINAGVQLDVNEEDIKKQLQAISNMSNIKLELNVDSDTIKKLASISKALEGMVDVLAKFEGMNEIVKGIKQVASASDDANKKMSAESKKRAKEEQANAKAMAKAHEEALKENLRRDKEYAKQKEAMAKKYSFVRDTKSDGNNLLKVSDKDVVDGSKTNKTKIGSNIANKTATTRDKQLVSEETVKDFATLDKYISKLDAKTKDWSRSTKIAEGQVEDIKGKFGTLKGYLETDVNMFNKMLAEVKGLEQSLDDVVKAEKNQTATIKSKVEWQNKLNKAVQSGLGNHKSIEKFERMINAITEDEILDQTKLIALAKQHALIKKQEADANFRNNKNNKRQDLQNTLDKKIDKNVVGQDAYNKVQSKLTDVSNSPTDQKFATNVRKAKQSIDELIQSQDKLNKQMKVDNAINDFQQRLNKLSHTYTEFGLVINGTSLSKVHTMFNELSSDSKDLVSDIAKINKEIQKMETMPKKMGQLEDKFSSVGYRATRGFDNSAFSRKELGVLNQQKQEIADLFKVLAKASTEEFDDVVNHIERKMSELNRTSSQLRDRVTEKRNDPLLKFGDALKKVPIWIGAMGLMYGAINQVQQGFQSILQIDRAMIDLQKVTEASTEELKKFEEQANTIGQSLGTTTATVIEATYKFQQLGYSLQQATVLGQNSILYANVGDLPLEKAQDNLVSTLKGFDIAVDQSGQNVRKVVDLFNEVSNNFSISSEGIGEALRRSSSTLKEGGNDINQAVALATAGNSVIQDPERVGTALKTISMRVRGFSEEGSKLGALVPQLEKEFNSFGKSIMKDGDSFKSTFEIFNDLHESWGSLTDLQRANLVEMIGGKQQGAIVSAIINNWSDALGSYETALNSSGSAQEEFLTYMEGFDYKIGRLKGALESFWAELINSDGIKDLIDGLTALVNGLTKVAGLIGSSIIPMGLALATMKYSDFFLNTAGSMDKMVGKAKLVTNATEEIADGMVDASSKTKKLSGTATTVASSVAEIGVGGTRGATGLGRMASVGAKAFSVLWRFGKLFTIFGAITLGVEALTYAFTYEAKQRQEKIKQLQDEIKYTEQLHELAKQSGVDKFLELDTKKDTQKGFLDTDDMREYLSVQTQISEGMPQLVDHYNAEGRAVLKSTEYIRSYFRELEKVDSIKKQELFKVEVEDANFGKLEDAIEKYHSFNDTLKENDESALGFQQSVNIIKSTVGNLSKDSNEYALKVEEAIGKIRESLSAKNLNPNTIEEVVSNVRLQISEGGVKGLEEFTNNAIEGFENQKEALQMGMEKVEGEVNLQSQEFNNKLSVALTNAMNIEGIDKGTNTFLVFDNLRQGVSERIENMNVDVKKVLSEFPDVVAEINKQAKDQKIDLGQMLGDGDNEGVTNFLKGVLANMKKGSAQAKILEQAILGIQNALKESPKEQPFDMMSDLTTPLGDTLNSISDLRSAFETLSKGEELNIEQIQSLLVNHQELNKSVYVQNGVLKIHKNAIKEVMKAREEDFKLTVEANNKKLQSEKATAIAQIKAIYSVSKAELDALLIKQRTVKEIIGLANQMVVANAIMEEGSFNSQMHNSKGSDYNNRKMGDQRTKDLQARLKNLQDIQNSINVNKNMGDINFDKNINLGKDKKDKKEMQDGYYVADKFNQKMEQLNYTLEKQKEITDDYAEGSDAYKKSLATEISLITQKGKAIDSEIASLQKQIKAGKIQQKGLITLSKEDNKTARLKSAEIQQKIDEARSQLIKLQTDKVGILQELEQQNMRMIEVTQSYFETQRGNYEKEIRYQERVMGLHESNTKMYVDSANVKVDAMKKQLSLHAKEIAYLEKEYKDTKKYNYAQRQAIKDLIKDKRIAVYDLQDAIDSINMDKLDKLMDDSARKYQELQNRFTGDEDNINRHSSRLESDDYSGKIDDLRKILALKQGELEANKKEIENQVKLRTEYKDNENAFAKVNERIKELQKEQKDLTNAIEDTGYAIKDIYGSMADEFVNAYKQSLDLMKQAELDRIEDVGKAQSDAHDKRMKELEDEADKINKTFEEKFKLMDREKQKSDFGKDMSKLKQEELEIQNKINKLSVDNSYEAKAKVSELQKQLQEKQAEIRDKETDRAYDLQKEKLEDLQQLELEKVEGKQKAEDESYKITSESLEDQREAIEKHYEKLMNDEREFAKLRKLALEGNVTELSNILQGWADKTSQLVNDTTDMSLQNMLDNIKAIKDELSQLQSLGANTSGQAGQVPTNNSPTASTPIPSTPVVEQPKPTTSNKGKVLATLNLKQTADKNAKSLPTVVKKGESVDILSAGNGFYRVKYKGHLGYIASSNLQKYDTGGYTGDWSGNGGKLAMLHKKEIVLNQSQTKDILSTAKIVDRLKGIIQKQNVSALFTGKGNVSGDTNNNSQQVFNINMNVENMNGDKKGMKTMTNEMVNEIKKTKGGKF